MTPAERWARFKNHLCSVPSLDVHLDLSRMGFDEPAVLALGPSLQRAFDEMTALEAGAIANADEQRMVGHYWLREPERAPAPELGRAIVAMRAQVASFASRVHQGVIAPERAPRFRQLLVIGIGGSALGPMLVARALRSPHDRLESHFLDNTDPDGMDELLARLADRLAETLTVVISKSGTTPETRNGMLEVEAAYARAGLRLGRHAVAVTGDRGALCDHAADWLQRFPMWDWVGGRTSVTSAVGLLPAALAGYDVDAFLEGARLMDQATRQPELARNPAARLAAAWHLAGNGRGDRAMVVLPYRDRLELFARYLQQLVMESLGKGRDRKGHPVQQGIVVYGNKGSTDQHAYVQQLREGRDDFFATFIETRRLRRAPSIEVQPGVTTANFLHGFLLGTREALAEAGRPSMTITVPDADARSLGALIALYERAVGLYASLVDINAYHQPGVEAGKKAAAAVLALQGKVLEALGERRGQLLTPEEVAAAAGTDDVEAIWHLCEHLAAGRRILRRPEDAGPFDARYGIG